LGADGTVGANKNSVKILADDPSRYAQGYFVYDSKKSGSSTISHLRFGPKPIHAPYLLKSASFIGVHKFDFVFKQDVLGAAAPGATVLINSPYGPAGSGMNYYARAAAVNRQEAETVCGRRIQGRFDLGLGARINTILQTCFSRSGVLPRNEAIAAIKSETERTTRARAPRS
jgi:pyruvate-ferredoxin/flavodoxin oxidoreductase